MRCPECKAENARGFDRCAECNALSRGATTSIDAQTIQIPATIAGEDVLLDVIVPALSGRLDEVIAGLQGNVKLGKGPGLRLEVPLR